MRPINAPAWLIERPIAHRGLHDAAKGIVENTLAAAEAAILARFAIECDLQMSRDGEAFVFHDDTLDRLTSAHGRLIEKSAGEIAGARITGSSQAPPTFAKFLTLVAGRSPIICELKSRFDGDWRVADRAVEVAAAYQGPLAFKSFDPDLIAYLKLRRPREGSSDALRPIGIVAEASLDDPHWDFLTAEQKRDWTGFEHFDRLRPDFLSWNVDNLPHKVPFMMKELNGAPVMAWTVRNAVQREAAATWADQIVFEGEGRP
jgi:glycerophosphoryl diester phosphodiesterase